MMSSNLSGGIWLKSSMEDSSVMKVEPQNDAVFFITYSQLSWCLPGWHTHDTRLESKQEVVSLAKATRLPYLAFFSSSSMVRAVMMASVRARVFQGFTRSAPTKLQKKNTRIRISTLP
jgi:hypothetical protein